MIRSVAQAQTAGKEERLASLSEAAWRWGVSIHTVRYWIQHGKIESAKLGGRRLIPVSEIDRLIEQSRVPALAETQ